MPDTWRQTNRTNLVDLLFQVSGTLDLNQWLVHPGAGNGMMGDHTKEF